jgi:MFS family permease
LGIFSSVTGIAVLAGPVVGGAVAQGLDWPWIFWLNVPIGLVMIPLILARIPAAERSRASLDPIGLLLAATSALGIVWALIRANTLGWTSPEIPATLAAGIVLGAAFIGWELRVADPMVPLRLFRSRPIAAGNAATFSVFALLMAMVFFMAQFLETGLPYWHLVPPLLLAGCGVSMAIPATMSAVMTAVPPAAIGQASGTLNTLRQLGGVFGVAICAAVFAARGHYASPATFVAGFGPAMAACAGLALLGAAASLVIPGRRQAPASAVAVQPVQNHAPKIEIRR